MRRLASTALALSLLFSGCAALKPAEKELGRPEAAASSIRANAIVEFKKKILGISGRAVVLAKSPGSFRIEVAGPFGQTAALIASDGERLYIRSMEDSSEYQWGDPKIPYSFEAGEVTSFLLGRPIPSAKPGVKETTDAEGHLKKYTKAGDGRPALVVKLDDYRDKQGAHIPFSISIEDGKRTLSIRYTEVEVNPALEQALFTLDDASGTGPKEVD